MADVNGRPAKRVAGRGPDGAAVCAAGTAEGTAHGSRLGVAGAGASAPPSAAGPPCVAGVGGRIAGGSGVGAGG
ncbi:hypothetical protein GCM10022245_66570 [Streptomyces mayteni]